MKISISGSLFILILLSADLSAEIKLPAIFGDNMVLQQQTSVAFWGFASKNAKISLKTSWNGRSYTTRANQEGEWNLKVATPSAGGPYTVTVSDGKAITLKNVMIGEVWICSGQSNMEMPMKGYYNQPITGSNEFIATSGNDNIRLITVPRATSLVPKGDFEGRWKICEPESVSDFSATAYFFGLMLNRALDVPVGLICAAWGGTRIEPWINEAGIRNFNWVELPDKSQAAENPLSPRIPTVLFNGMIHPVAGYGIRGAIWYQGESNKNEPVQYEKLLPGLALNWRSVWGVGDFPFYFVQIAPYDYGSGLNSAFLREAQFKASKAIPGLGMACIMDAGERNCIHPAGKKAAGDRLAYQALIKTYGMKGFASDGPELKEMKINGAQVMLSFNNAPNGLTSFGKELSCFEIAGSNKRFYPATAFITRTGVTLFSPFVNEPVAVRYAFKDFIIGDLFNIEEIPASSFRTDDWEIQ